LKWIVFHASLDFQVLDLEQELESEGWFFGLIHSYLAELFG